MSVVAAAGFVAGGTACGIKPDGGADLAVVATSDGRPVAAAATFTSNLAAAAPVVLSREQLEKSGGQASAVVVNSGCANAATGAPGRDDAERMAAAAATALGAAAEHVLVCSTGPIGERLPIALVESALPELVANTGDRHERGDEAAAAILTTDTCTKQVVVETGGIVVGGMAKGAAMLAPNMATMLAILTTDAAVGPDALRRALALAVDGSFNQITIDGCTSTNDTVIVLSSGRGPAVEAPVLQSALVAACGDLATQMVADAEGGTKSVTVRVLGAPDAEAARAAARKVAEDSLVKASFCGEDPNWGRVVSALGSSGAPFSLERVSVRYGDVIVCRDGMAAAHDAAALAATLGSARFEVVCDLGLGEAAATVLTSDLTPGYVEFNMGRS